MAIVGNTLISKTSFYQHKLLYYDRLSKKWSSTRINYSELEAEQVAGPSSIAFTISNSESENEDVECPLDADQYFPCAETLPGEGI